MKKYFCDVCGAEVDGNLRLAPKPSNKAAEICGLEDLCPSCEEMSRSLDVSTLVLAELRFRAGKGETVPVAASTLSFEPTGRGAKEKRAILEAIKRFRQEHGPVQFLSWQTWQECTRTRSWT